MLYGLTVLCLFWLLEVFVSVFLNNHCTDKGSKSEPSKRNLDYICAYIQNGKNYNGECSTLERVICLIDAVVTCPDLNWVLNDSRCFKTVSGGISDGQDKCQNLDPDARLMLPRSSKEASTVSSMFPGDNIWLGLRFHMGAEWIWNDGLKEPISWGVTPYEPQLCVGVWNVGYMFDFHCYNKIGVICQKDIDGSGLCESGWEVFGIACYKRLRNMNSAVTFSEARTICSTINAYILMPKSASEASSIVTSLDCGTHCWIGITDFDADHTYTWEDGTDESQSNLYFGSAEPNRRDLDYICAIILDGLIHDRDCTVTEKLVCEINAASTTVSTTKEPISSVESETEVTSERSSTALKVSSHISSVLSKTSTEHPQIPTQTTKYADDATAQTTHTQTSRIRPTTISSPNRKSNCSQSTTNSCHCQKRTVANTSENKNSHTLKVSDFIWLKKCALQPMIDPGMVNVLNCPYVCKCSPKGSTKSQEEMFACVRRS